jgi:hypothetical protein
VVPACHLAGENLVPACPACLIGSVGTARSKMNHPLRSGRRRSIC